MFTQRNISDIYRKVPIKKGSQKFDVDANPRFFSIEESYPQGIQVYIPIGILLPKNLRNLFPNRFSPKF
ncbi:hypothetical protein CH365_02470 [Leptospira neocaledonica]|uniref:Uncharacterized protein n=1 Tax=Leptospira neocaledonica TaxID=2023192 RepID=A0A2N0A1L7_9LEPT|nr:hypothetical protein CH365_02470 [Leptospira neocaledonica]